MRQVLAGIVVTSLLVLGLMKFEEDGLSSLLSNSRSSRKAAVVTVSEVEWSADSQALMVQSRGGVGAMRSLSFHHLIDGQRQIPQWAELLQGGIYRAAMSADGTSVVLAPSTGDLLWIDVGTSAVTHLDRLGWFFSRTAISHDGQIAAGARQSWSTWSAKDEDEVYLWYPTRGEVKQLSVPPESTVAEFRFSPEGSRLLGIFADGSIRIWETTTGALVHEILGQRNFATGAAFLKNESRVISLGDENLLQITDLLGDSVQWRGLPGTCLPLGTGALDVNSSGTFAAWVERSSSQIVVWDIEQQRIKFEIENPSVVLSLKFSPDGTSLAVGGTESVVRIYSMKSGRQTQMFDVRKA